MFTGLPLLVWVTWRGFYSRLTLRGLVREWLLGQVRHVGNWSAVPEEGSCHVAGIKVVLVGMLNPCNGRDWKGAAEAGSQATWDPASSCGRVLGPLDLRDLLPSSSSQLPDGVSTTGRFVIASTQPTGVSVGRQQQAVTTESRAFLAASGQAGSFNVWTSCSNVFRQVSVCLFPNINVRSSYLPQIDWEWWRKHLLPE